MGVAKVVEALAGQAHPRRRLTLPVEHPPYKE